MASSTASLIARLPTFALPFVTRSLRGGRGRRFIAASFGLALLTLVASLWIGLGRGDTARDARVQLGMERPVHQRESAEFVVVRNERFDTQRGLAARKAQLTVQGQRTVRAAVEQRTLVVEQFELRERARALADTWGPTAYEEHSFAWHDPAQVERLAKIVERGGVPAVVDYEPVVELRGMLQLLAMLTGGLLIVLTTVVAPLLVALQQANERHENTLQPLTGTGLDARDLAIGLASGPLTIVAIFAAPIALLFVLATLVVGPWLALVLLPGLAGTAIGLVFGAQLLAHLIGARRNPGLIAVGLLVLLGFVGLASLLAGGAELERDLVGVTAVLPQAGLFALLGECFGEPWRLASPAHVHSSLHPELYDFLVPTLIGTLGATLLGLLALRALTGHIEGRDTLLEAGHARFGALVSVVMVNVAIPTLEHQEPLHQAVGLPPLALPFVLLIMARVPIGDMPTKLRRIPLLRLLGEFAGWTLLHVSLAAAIDGTLAGLHPIALLGIAWSVLVLVLLGIRIAATPGRILGHVWALICLAMLPGTYGFMTVCALEPLNMVEAAAELPVLAMVWIVMLFWVPISLIRHLRKHVAQLA
jgi:hypothetical protein